MLRTRIRLTALFAVATMTLALVPTTAQAYHATNTVISGKDYTGANAQRFHPGQKTVYVGQTVTIDFAAGAHNAGIDSGSLPSGASPFRSSQFVAGNAETVGSSYAYTFTTTGTYSYYCNIHASQNDADGATFNANGEPSNGKMVGRVVVQVDSTGPTWAGSPAPTATAVSSSQIDLAWPSASDPETGISQYRVYEATGATRPAKPATPVATPSGTSLSRTGLTAGTHYWYWITAVNGAGTASSTDQLVDAVTTSVAASASASGVVKFSVNPTLSISVSPSVLDLGTLSPEASATGSQTVNVKSNDAWSLKVKSVGRNGSDEGPGDDAVFTSGARTIPVSRMTWKVGAGSPAAMSDTDATVLTGQPATSSSGANTAVDLALQLQYSDPAASDYQTVLLYTATQP